MKFYNECAMQSAPFCWEVILRKSQESGLLLISMIYFNGHVKVY